LPSIRILVVDDHDVVRRNLCDLLTTEPDLAVVDEAVSGHEAVDKAQKLQPNVILLDISMPELNGLVATRLIKKVAPDSEILIVTSHRELFLVREAFIMGARGFLCKSDVPTELIGAVRQVYSKQKFLSKDLEDPVLDATEIN
jgi:two-component system, NarL family, response regulator NreC